MRVAIYVQDSTVRAMIDLRKQEQALRRLAAEKGYEVVSVFSDIDPVVDPDRQGMNALREAIRERRFDAVVALSADRLYQDAESQLGFAEECRRMGVRVDVPDFEEAIAEQIPNRRMAA